LFTLNNGRDISALIKLPYSASNISNTSLAQTGTSCPANPRPELHKCKGLILLATGALGQTRLFWDLLKQVKSVLSFAEFAGIGLRGYNANAEEMKKLFFLPTTVSTCLAGNDEESIEAYYHRTKISSTSRFGEGMTTYTHAVCS